MTNIENIDDENNENNHCDSKFETTIVPTSISVPNGQQTQTCVLQQTTTAISYHRNGHSRNPSSINGITIAQVMQPPLNKPDTIDSLLKLLRFRDSYKDGYENCADIDVEKKQRQICGIREARLIMISILILVFLISGTVFFVMWFTEYYNDSIVSSLVLKKNSTALEYFIKPPLNPQLRVHIFNYTNVDEFLEGKHDKLIVKDIGPLVYTERTEKVDVQYNDNNTISYRESRSFEFRRDISMAGQSDTVIVPNIPFLTGAWKLIGMSYFDYEQIFIKGYHMTSKPFVAVKADSFLWGYDDDLYEWSKKSSNPPKPDKFGILASRNGVSVESFTINSGVDDIRKLNVIDNFNGDRYMNLWSTKECNRVDGTDGAQFPPHLMDQKQPLEVFIKAFCRKFPMHFDSEVSLFNGVPAWRYKAPKNVFDSPDKNPANQCYCHIDSGKCAPSGVFNATLCFNAPIYSSYPHFLYGDKSLFENIEGLNPKESAHLTYADIHPRLAFPMAGSSRFQINIQVYNKNAVALKRFKPDQILPIIWMEVTSSEVPEELRAMIYHSTFSANAIQLSLRYGSLFGLAVSMAILVAGCYLSNSDNESNRRKHEVEEVVTINMDVTKVQTADQSSETEHIKITKMSS